MKILFILVSLLSLSVSCSRNSDNYDPGTGSGSPHREAGTGAGSER